MTSDGMLLAVEELSIPVETLSALRSAGIQHLGDIVSKEDLKEKGFSPEQVTQISSTMTHFNLCLPRLKCKEGSDG